MVTEVAKFYEYSLQLNEPPGGVAIWQITRNGHVEKEGGAEIVTEFCAMAKEVLS